MSPPTPPSACGPAGPAPPLTLYTKVHTKSMKPTCSLGSSAALFRSIIGCGGSRSTVKGREQVCQPCPPSTRTHSAPSAWMNVPWRHTRGVGPQPWLSLPDNAGPWEGEARMSHAPLSHGALVPGHPCQRRRGAGLSHVPRRPESHPSVLLPRAIHGAEPGPQAP